MKRRPGEDSHPPALVRVLLRLLLPAEEREFYLGDLEESGRRPWLRELVGVAALRLTPRRRRTQAGGRESVVFTVGPIAADMRLGIRRLMRSPASTLTALTALSVGIGLSAVMFGLISGGLLPTLPFEAGDRIVRVQRAGFAAVSAEAFGSWRARQRSFEGLGAWTERPVNLAIEGGGSEPVQSAAVSATALPLLSVQPVFGRMFTAADVAAGAPAVVLVGHDTWRTRLQADPGVVGRTVRVNGEPAEIVGVLPDGFGFPWRQELWTPLRLDALRPDRNPESLSVFGVLREGASIDVATAARVPRRAGEAPPQRLEPPGPVARPPRPGPHGGGGGRRPRVRRCLGQVGHLDQELAVLRPHRVARTPALERFDPAAADSSFASMTPTGSCSSWAHTRSTTTSTRR